MIFHRTMAQGLIAELSSTPFSPLEFAIRFGVHHPFALQVRKTLPLLLQ
jgi:hypothetical protein